MSGRLESIDRLPPHSPEAERAVLGTILDSPASWIPAAVTRFGSAAENAFYDLRHQTIYLESLKMWGSGLGVDMASLLGSLRDHALLDQVGGQAYLMDLLSQCCPESMMEQHMDQIMVKWRTRSMIKCCVETVGKLYESSGDSEEIIGVCESDILRASRECAAQASIPMRSLITEAMGTIEDYHKRKGIVTGIASGFADLDKMTTGFQPGEMIVIAGRPGTGKTSFAMGIASRVSTTDGVPVGVFSLEMTSKSLAMRMLCSMATVNLRNVREGFLAERDVPKITGSAGRLAKAPIHIDDSSGLSILQLRARARRMASQFGIKLWVVDYLQLLNALGGSRRCESRQQEVADISTGIKAMAKELNAPVIALSQLNREMDKTGGRAPRLSDLRESGAIENDADFVGLLHHRKRDDEDGGQNDECVAVTLHVAKQRNGPTGDVQLTFLRNYTRFESAAKVSDEDVPEQETINYHSPHND